MSSSFLRLEETVIRDASSSQNYPGRPFRADKNRFPLVQATARETQFRLKRHLSSSRGKALFPWKGHPESSLSYASATILLRKKYLLNFSSETVSNPRAKLEIAGAPDIIGVERPGRESKNAPRVKKLNGTGP